MRILMTFAHFPVSIPRYFKEAFESLGHTVYTAGIPFGNWIPWTAAGAQQEGMYLPRHYIMQPTVPLAASETYTWDAIFHSLPELPDFVLHHPTPPDPQRRFTAHIFGRPPRKMPYGLLLTDPHVLEWYYKGVRYDADYVFNMQDCYKQEGDYYIPYAYSPQYHYGSRFINERDLDVVCIGLQYQHRAAVMQELALDGLNVLSEVGHAFDEYRFLHNRAKVAFSWSSKMDTIARVFEAPRMGAALVTNWTPDLFKFFNDDEITTFRSGAEAVEACKRLVENEKEREQMVLRGWKAVEKHTYAERCAQMLSIVAENTPAVDYNRDFNKYLIRLKEQRRATA